MMVIADAQRPINGRTPGVVSCSGGCDNTPDSNNPEAGGWPG
jgi:hypothetical protein